MPAEVEDEKLPIEDEKVVYLTEGAARRMLEKWAYKKAHKEGRGYKLPKGAALRKQKARDFLHSCSTRNCKRT